MKAFKYALMMLKAMVLVIADTALLLSVFYVIETIATHSLGARLGTMIGWLTAFSGGVYLHFRDRLRTIWLTGGTT